MAKNERVIQAIYRSIDELNQQLSKGQHLEKSLDGFLSRSSGKLDSLGLINLIVAIEQEIEEEFGVTTILMDEKIMPRHGNPFDNIGTLAGNISLLLEEK